MKANEKYIERIIEPSLELYEKDVRLKKRTENISEYLEEKKVDLYSEDKLIIPRVVIVVGTKCTLQCEHCSNLMPQYEIPYDIACEDVNRDINILLQAIDGCVGIVIIGGEPFIYPDLDKVIKNLQDNKKVEYIEFNTNATRIPEAYILELMKNDKMAVNMSDYGNIALLSKFADILDKNGILSYCYSDEKWIDCGDCKSRNRSDEELSRMYLDCGSGKMCKTILKGKLFDCPRAAHVYDLGYAKDIEFLELNEKLSKEEVERFFTKKISHACNYCDFASPDKVYVEPAVQKRGNKFIRS